MAMTACYPNYDMGLPSSQSMSHHHHHTNHASAMQQSSRTANLLSQQSPQNQQPQKDYSIPLHVDCSVEYELPNQAKPPPGARVEPLLMIHPCYFRKMESQRRSPFINNMPNSSSTRSAASITNSQSSVTASSSAPTTAHMSSSRRPNVLASTSSSVVSASSSAKNQSNAHLMTNSNVISSHQNHMHQQQQSQQPPTHMTHRSQNLQQQQQQQQPTHHNMQAQIDDYVQRQMAHISQQPQYQHQQQSSSQYNAMQSQQQHQQMRSAGDWERYMNVSNPNMLGKVNIPNQNAYKKSGKRQLAATCANTYSTSHIEGSLPNGIIRWDEKTASMAAIPRDFQSGPESIPSVHQQHHQSAKTSNNANNGNVVGNGSLYRGASSQQHAIHMNGKHDRDPMLSGGCIYNSNNSNSNLNASNLATSGLWEPIQKSPMAAIPNNKYQAGPDSIPNSNHSSSNSNNNNKASGLTHRQPTGSTVIHHSHYPQQQQSHQQQQQHILQNEKMLNNNANNNNNNVITVKYRQYRNSHRMHPYMMSTAPSVNSALSGVSSYFPQLNGPFPQIQQVSCYNV